MANMADSRERGDIMTNVTSSGARRKTSRIFGQRLVKQRFQLTYMLMVFIFLASTIAVAWLFGRLVMHRMVSTAMVTDAAVIQHLQLMFRTILQISVLALGIVLLLSLIFSHSVAGPVYRFEKTLEEMRNGNLTVFVRLRRRDQFQETGDLFNQTLVSLRRRIQQERETVQASLGGVVELAKKLRQGGLAAEAAELDRLVSEARAVPPQIRIE